MLRAQNTELYDKIAETFLLYDYTWPPPHRQINIFARKSSTKAPQASGDFLCCARMLVDRLPEGLRATTRSGAQAIASFTGAGENWHVAVPESLIETGKLEEIEDILSLVLTTGWRRNGWTPIHAAAVIKGPTSAIICAPTGGGKTTLTAALVRRGWHVLGDDKLLLRMRNGKPEIAALLHTFNLHPKTREWFPEVGDLERLPRYSAWTEKRKVSVASIWSHAPAQAARPSLLVSLQRRVDAPGVFVRPLREPEVLATLLRQTVIPSDAVTAREIVANVAGAAAQLRGLLIEVATDAYRDPQLLVALERALESHQ